jgi:hypothetical protein
MERRGPAGRSGVSRSLSIIHSHPPRPSAIVEHYLQVLGYPLLHPGGWRSPSNPGHTEPYWC